MPYWKMANAVEVLPPLSNFKITLPVNIDSLPKDFAQNFQETISIPARRIFILQNVYVLWYGLIFKNLRIFIPSLSYFEGFQSLKRGHVLVQQWTKYVPEINTEPVALVYDDWASTNYFHWMIESLPRLLALSEFHPNCLIFVPANLPEYIKITTRLFGFNRLIPLKENDTYKVARLIFPESNAPLEHQNPLVMNKIRNIIIKNYSLPIEKPKKRIYVSRSRQSIRRIRNEERLSEILERFEFETVYFEDLTFEKQVELMMQASIMLSVHGANLTNILFMSPGSTIIELMNKNFNNAYYFGLASALSLPYYCIPCDLVDPTINPANYILNNNADLLVDLNKVEQTLKMAL
jgi:hypothetical protein